MLRHPNGSVICLQNKGKAGSPHKVFSVFFNSNTELLKRSSCQGYPQKLKGLGTLLQEAKRHLMAFKP